MVKARHVFISTVIILACALSAWGASQNSMQGFSELEGTVQDHGGRPLGGAIVSVFGKNLYEGAITAVTDAEGRFEVAEVPPGLYRLRAYLKGFLPSPYAKIVIEEGVERVSAILMSLASLDSEKLVQDTEERRTLDEFRWVLQRGERNILKDEERYVGLVESESTDPRPSSGPRFAIRGEFGIEAAAFEQGLDEFPGGGAGLDANLASARLFIPTTDDGHWLVSAQVLESVLSSWAGRAEVVSGDMGGHRLTAGITYGSYLYGDLHDFRPPEAALWNGGLGQRSAEWFGSLYGADSFLVGPVSIQARLAYRYFDYLSKPGYLTPQLSVAYPLGEGEKTLIRGVVDYRVLAPGGEDIGLLSNVAFSDVYGPLPARREIRAERTARLQLGLEQQVSETTRLGVRLFQENASDQLVKSFIEDRPGTPGGAGHFIDANQGDFESRGLGLSVSQRFGATEGTVGYTYGMARALEAQVSSRRILGEEEIHDVTTVFATSIDRTRTRLRAALRVTSHPIFVPGLEGFASGSTLESRFNFQVYQLLPFVGWNGTQWEVMMAVRNMFYEDIEGTSILDEMSVIDAPRRLLGGVTVRF